MNDPRLARIRELMADVRALHPSSGQAGRTMSVAELDAFEVDQGVSLPEGYRAFLECFGDGAWLPAVVGGYALPLADNRGDAVWSTFEGPITEPFRFSGREPVAMAWDEQADDYARMDPMAGTICLGSGGCDVVYVLVVTGEARGTVWSFVPGLDQELRPSGQDFLDFTITRMERKLAEHQKYARWREEDE